MTYLMHGLYFWIISKTNTSMFVWNLKCNLEILFTLLFCLDLNAVIMIVFLRSDPRNGFKSSGSWTGPCFFPRSLCPLVRWMGTVPTRAAGLLYLWHRFKLQDPRLDPLYPGWLAGFLDPLQDRRRCSAVCLGSLAPQCFHQWVQRLDLRSTALEPCETAEASSLGLEMPAHAAILARGSHVVSLSKRD